MILKQLEADLFFGQEPNKFEEFFCRDGSGALFFDFSLTRGADAKLEVRSGNGHAATFGFNKQIGEDGDGRLAFDHPLGHGQFVK